jgi:hypothetical protein
MRYLSNSIFFFFTALTFFSYRFWGYDDVFFEKTEILKDFSFETHSDGRGGKNYLYYIHLVNDLSKYQIPAKFIDDFKIIEFEREVKSGDRLTIVLSADKNKLSGSYTIYGVQNETKIYLDIANTKNSDWLEKNIALPFFSLFLTFIAILNAKKFRINRKTSANSAHHKSQTF